MAYAAIYNLAIIGSDNDGFSVNGIIGYTGAEIPGGSDLAPLDVHVLGSDNANQIKTKLGDAVLGYAASLGYVVQRNEITILGTLDKG